MITLERIDAAMTEAGPLEDEIVEIRRTSEDEWSVAIDDAIVTVECDTALERLMFSLQVGPLPSERRQALIELMMTYTAMWRDNGSIRVGLANPAATRS